MEVLFGFGSGTDAFLLQHWLKRKVRWLLLGLSEIAGFHLSI